MRPKGSRKVNREPVRSPSPDISNKNIIANTMAPLAEVLSKSKVTSISYPDSQDDLRGEVSRWREKYMVIEKEFRGLLG